MDKPTLYYTVRVQENRLTHQPIYVPAIVEREQSVPLNEIVRRAIDRSLIPGLKATAAVGIADAIARQMYEEFSQGRGVRFGSYFYARLYLDGTTNANGVLTKANSLNVRFVSGPSFKLTLDMFAFSNISAGDVPLADFLVSDTDGAIRNVLKPSAVVNFNGQYLWKEGDVGTKVEFFEIDPATGEPASEASATVETDNFSSKGPNLLTFAYPTSGLVRGKSYSAVASRSADGERWFTGAGVTVSIEEEA